jgi:hypothetical protein
MLGQLAQQSHDRGLIQATRHRANTLGHPPTSWCQLDPANGLQVHGHIPPGPLVACAVAEFWTAAALVEWTDRVGSSVGQP